MLSIHHCLKVLKMMVSNPPVYMGGFDAFGNNPS